MPSIKRIEFQTGQLINMLALPEELKIEGQRKKSPKKKDKTGDAPEGAFQERLAKNTKEHNYGTREKRRQKGKASKKRNY